jgi:hypothetical protein
MAAAQPTTTNIKTRLERVFDGYCATETKLLDFESFVRMVFHIQKYLGGDSAGEAVRCVATPPILSTISKPTLQASFSPPRPDLRLWPSRSAAEEVFRESGIDIKVGAIQKAQFVNACLMEAQGRGFRGSGGLLRLPSSGTVEQQRTPPLPMRLSLLPHHDRTTLLTDGGRGVLLTGDRPRDAVESSWLEATPSPKARRLGAGQDPGQAGVTG